MRGPGRLPAVERAKLGIERKRTSECQERQVGLRQERPTPWTPLFLHYPRGDRVQMCRRTPTWKNTLMTSVPLGGGRPAPGRDREL